MRDELSRLYDYDESKFRQNSARELDSVVTHPQIIARLIYSAHAIEKGLSNDNFQQGRGLDNIRLLVHLVEVYHRRQYDKNHPSYVAAISCLKEFYNAHAESVYLLELRGIYGDYFDEIMACVSDSGGASTVLITSKMQNRDKNFKALAEGRASVRSYSEEQVSLDYIRDALSIAMKTPTVCNRQSIKVRFIQVKKVIDEVLKIQGGAVGYETPPMLLLITADDAAYLGANERNQGFIDGGLFAMSVLYALEYKGLAACALNTTFTELSEKVIRGMMNIPEGEKLITFISVGHFKESNNICKSFRYSVDSILTEVNEIHPYLIQEDEGEHLNEVSWIDKLRVGLRLRTRLKNTLLLMKHKTRVRTRLRSAKEFLLYERKRRKFSTLDGGIITLIDYNNYGNIMQRYALQEFLLLHGHAFVSYEHDLPIVNDLNDGRLRFTAEFIKRHVYTKPFSEDEILASYIVGSDQIWRDFTYENPKDQLGFFFLNFLKESDVKRIAYAASIGRNSLEEANITPELSSCIATHIRKFNAVSVREKTAASIVKDAWGVDSEIVIDPTMLLSADVYSNLIRRSNQDINSVDGVFTYLIGVSDENERFLKKAAQFTGSDLYRIDLADYSGPLPPVEQWLCGLRDAKLAIIDSFHGAVFSIINNTDFVVLENKGSGMERMINLLELFGVEGRIVKHTDVDRFSFEDVPPIDWSQVNMKLAKLRSQSAKWLLDAVQTK